MDLEIFGIAGNLWGDTPKGIPYPVRKGIVESTVKGAGSRGCKNRKAQAHRKNRRKWNEYLSGSTPRNFNEIYLR